MPRRALHQRMPTPWPAAMRKNIPELATGSADGGRAAYGGCARELCLPPWCRIYSPPRSKPPTDRSALECAARPGHRQAAAREASRHATTARAARLRSRWPRVPERLPGWELRLRACPAANAPKLARRRRQRRPTRRSSSASGSSNTTGRPCGQRRLEVDARRGRRAARAPPPARRPGSRGLPRGRPSSRGRRAAPRPRRSRCPTSSS